MKVVFTWTAEGFGASNTTEVDALTVADARYQLGRFLARTYGIQSFEVNAVSPEESEEKSAIRVALYIFDDNKKVWNRARLIPRDMAELSRQKKLAMVPMPLLDHPSNDMDQSFKRCGWLVSIAGDEQ